jgi:hypothetical protein
LLNQSCYIVAVKHHQEQKKLPSAALWVPYWAKAAMQPLCMTRIYTVQHSLLFMVLENPSIAWISNCMITNVQSESHDWSAPAPESTSLTCLSCSKTIYCFASQPYNLKRDIVISSQYLSNAVTRMQMFNCIWNRFQTMKYSGIQFNLVSKQNQIWIKWAYLKEQFNNKEPTVIELCTLIVGKVRRDNSF